MKKVSAILLTLVLLFSLCSISAQGENAAPVISFRNDIHFYDSEEVVRNKEDGKLVSYDHLPLDPDYGLPLNRSGFVQFFGEKNTDVYYHFDNDGLAEVTYHFMTNDKSLSDRLLSALQDKYGEPLNNRHGVTSDVTGYAFVLPYNNETSATHVSWLDYQEWIVEQDGYKVKIDLFSGFILSGRALSPNICISYKRFISGGDGTTNTALRESEYDMYKDDDYNPADDI